MKALVIFDATCAAVVLGFFWLRPQALRLVRRALARWGNVVPHDGIGPCFAVAAVAFAFAAYLSAVNWPRPRVLDEFSYLLAADTFANGRLTNPSPALWEHFQVPFVLFRPTYQSIYPPAQGLFLAAGQVVAGHPAVGVWLSYGAAFGALVWTVRGYVPGRWAVGAALLALMQFGVFGDWLKGRFFYWGHSYWGGSVPFLAGCLVFGSLPRLFKTAAPREAFVLGLGLVLLALSRPFEGVVVALPVAVLLVAPLWGRRSVQGGIARPAWIRRVVLPVGAVLVLGLAWLGYYHFQVTGNAFTLPHWLYHAEGDKPLFFWDGLGRAGPGWGPEGLVRYARQEFPRRYARLWMFYLGPTGTVCLPGIIWAWRRRWWARFACCVVGLLVAANAFALAGFPHYFAPVASLGVVLAVQGFRVLARRPGFPRTLAWSAVLAHGVTFVVAVALYTGFSLDPNRRLLWSDYRARFQETLEATPGTHLVLVRYAPDHYPKNEWTYNGADLEGAKVVWARARDPVGVSLLLRHYRYRTVWEVAADASPPRLVRSRYNRAKN